MSIKVMTQVWEQSMHQSGSLIVLLAMADHADDEGGSIFPSVQKLAAKARLKDRQVQRAIKSLMDSGELILVNSGGGRHQTNTYRIPMPFKKGVIKTPFQKGVICDAERVSFVTKKGVMEDTPSISNRQGIIRRAKGARKSSSFNPLGSLKTLREVEAETKAEIDEIMRPGGCCYRMIPKDPVKLARLDELRRTLTGTKAQISEILQSNAA